MNDNNKIAANVFNKLAELKSELNEVRLQRVEFSTVSLKEIEFGLLKKIWLLEEIIKE